MSFLVFFFTPLHNSSFLSLKNLGAQRSASSFPSNREFWFWHYSSFAQLAVFFICSLVWIYDLHQFTKTLLP